MITGEYATAIDLFVYHGSCAFGLVSRAVFRLEFQSFVEGRILVILLVNNQHTSVFSYLFISASLFKVVNQLIP